MRVGETQPFYLDVAARARDVGVSVNVLTLAGEECSMENLGTTADVTGGSVEVVEPSEMRSRVAALLRCQTLATAVEAQLVLPVGFHVRGQQAEGQATDAARRTLRLTCGSVTEETEMSIRFGCDKALLDKLAPPKASMPPKEDLPAAKLAATAMEDVVSADWEVVEETFANSTPTNETATGERASAPASAPATASETIPSSSHPIEVPVQMQLWYTLPNKERRLSVVSRTLCLTTDRNQAEAAVDAEVASLAAVHHAAGLAQAGEYVTARAALIGQQRLLQRTMRTPAHQRAYLRFIVQAEKLDGFMRERQAAESVFGACSKTDRKAQRDDEAAQAMYQMKSVTSTAFRARI